MHHSSFFQHWSGLSNSWFHVQQKKLKLLGSNASLGGLKICKVLETFKQFVKTYQSLASLCNMFKASYDVHNVADYLVISNHFRYSILVLMLLKYYHIPKIGSFTSVKHYRILNITACVRSLEKVLLCSLTGSYFRHCKFI